LELSGKVSEHHHSCEQQSPDGGCQMLVGPQQIETRRQQLQDDQREKRAESSMTVHTL
jgi:hypothetical protein